MGTHAIRATAIALLALAATAGCLTTATDAPAPGAAPNETPAAATPPPTDEGGGPADPARDAAPHVHDAWRGKDRLVILDADFKVEAPDAAIWAVMTAYFTHEPMAGGFFVDLPEGSFVHEGTGVLEISATSSDTTFTGMKLAYRHAGSSAFNGWVPVPRDAPAALAVTPEMTDMPHAKASRWAFVFSAEGKPAVAIGKVHVHMEIVRTRDLQLYPGHPDHWQGAMRLDVLEADGVTRSRQGVEGLLEQVQDPLNRTENVVPGDKPVPMETTTLVATVTVKEVTPAVLRVDHLRLVYYLPDGDGEVLPPGDAEVSEDRLTWTWRIPVEMKDTDSPYATTSAWAYRAEAAVRPPTGGPACEDGCGVAHLKYHLSVIAVRGPG